ncbi:MAG: 4-hydroxy-3-methylbut-2-enyl diphosphate reductase [Candidatus Moraniibacteriota bacterium]|nr:MAG: 4-hydroxy-3-methylbut-2-enyl diphosphate reductase [Candidatus Moranbacteria bacterium]
MAVTELVLASPRGFCAGVTRAVKAVEDTLALFGAPVYVKHEIVHNQSVVERLSKLGAITVEELTAVPEGSVVVFSAHGSPRQHYTEAQKRKLRLIDATCPLVTKVHLEFQRYIKDGYQVIYIGHRGHPEGIGVLGELPEVNVPLVETIADVEALTIPLTAKMVYLTQTTLSLGDTQETIGALKKKYPTIISPPLQDICYATTNRQEAVKELAKEVELVLVIGSQSSSNSNRLVETARATGIPAYLIDDARDINADWLHTVTRVGISAGASAPEDTVQSVVKFFTETGAAVRELVVKPETMHFAEPLELMQLRREPTTSR